ncbi:hypothetical protein RSAG8_08803, partial [Rhizoctonia solani AG-8 WAC10335]
MRYLHSVVSTEEWPSSFTSASHPDPWPPYLAPSSNYPV